MLLGLDVDINTWLFHPTPYCSESIIYTVEYPAQARGSGCMISTADLAHRLIQTLNSHLPITTKSFTVSQDHPSGSLVTFNKCLNRSRLPMGTHSSNTTQTGRFPKHQSPPNNVATTHHLVEAAPFVPVRVVTTGAPHILPNTMDLVIEHACS